MIAGSFRQGAAVPAIALAILAGCVGASSPASPVSLASPASPAPSIADVPSETVTGAVVSVDSSGLGAVSGFRLRTGDGTVLDIVIDGALEDAAAFPLGHLTEHAATAAPVRVTFRRSGGQLVATRIEDAD